MFNEVVVAVVSGVLVAGLIGAATGLMRAAMIMTKLVVAVQDHEKRIAIMEMGGRK